MPVHILEDFFSEIPGENYPSTLNNSWRKVTDFITEEIYKYLYKKELR